MVIRIGADDRVNGEIGDEEVYLPGAVMEDGTVLADQEEGPFQFTFPRIGKLISVQRRMRNMNVIEATSAEIDGILGWLAEGFGPAAFEHINARLENPDDLLDHEHMIKLYRALNTSQTGTGRPTTSSNGASRQPWKSKLTAAPSMQESASTN